MFVAIYVMHLRGIFLDVWLVCVPCYHLQRLGVGTFHVACHLRHFGAPFLILRFYALLLWNCYFFLCFFPASLFYFCSFAFLFPAVSMLLLCVLIFDFLLLCCKRPWHVNELVNKSRFRNAPNNIQNGRSSCKMAGLNSKMLQISCPTCCKYHATWKGLASKHRRCHANWEVAFPQCRLTLQNVIFF